MFLDPLTNSNLAILLSVCLQDTGLHVVGVIWQRPSMTRNVEPWLSDSRIGYNIVINHR